MSAQPKNILKGYFVTGAKPTQAQFGDQIDSFASINGSGVNADILAITGLTTPLSTAQGGTGNTTGAATINANLTGPITSVGNATSVASQTGTGSKFVMDTSPILVTPNIGTPSAGVLTNCTGLPAAGGGTGLSTYAVGDIIAASATTPTLSKIAAVALGKALISQGANTLPAWGVPYGALLNVQAITASGTYTPTSGTRAALIFCQGAGGGGGGSGTGGAGNGGTGGASSLGSLAVANGGTGGIGTAGSIQGGSGGTASAGLLNITGGDGGSGTAAGNLGGLGGSSFFGGGGKGGSDSAGVGAAANSGAGGGGAGDSGQLNAGGGGAGGISIAYVTGITGTYVATIGAVGAAGTAGTGGFAGGVGGTGVILILEFA